MGLIGYWLRRYTVLIVFLPLVVAPAGVVVFSESLAQSPENSLTEITGMKHVAQKIELLKSALYWQTRSWRTAGTGSPQYWEPIKRVFGNLYSLNQDGTVNYTYFEGDKIKYGVGILADVDLKRLEDTAQYLLTRKEEPAIISIYNQDYVLVWINQKPFNLELVQKGFGKPAIHPPTSLVDRMFADYYWMLLRKH